MIYTKYIHCHYYDELHIQISSAIISSKNEVPLRKSSGGELHSILASVLVKVTKRKVCAKGFCCQVVRVGSLYHRVIGVIHLSDTATLAVPSVEAVCLFLLP